MPAWEDAVGRGLRIVALVVAVLAAYLALWPVPIEPVAWRAPASPGYTGPHAANQRLSAAQAIPVGPEIGPEHIDFGPDGKLYTGVLSGAVLRMDPDGSALETVVHTGGRPLGLDFTADGQLVIADSIKGLLALQPDGTLRVLADSVDGDPIRYANAVVIARDGLMYFTDATRRFAPAELGTFDAALLDVIEHSCTGRVLAYEPATNHTSVVISGLCFPNGVALSGDERHLFIAETGEYRIWKVQASARGLEAGQLAPAGDQRARVVAANLPGFPDNLTRSAEGRLWTGLTKPRSPTIDGMSGRPWLRALTLRLPRSLWPVPPAYGHVIAFDEEGHVVADLQDPAGSIEETSGVTEHGGRLYVHSLHATAFGVIDAGTAQLAPRGSPDGLEPVDGVHHRDERGHHGHGQRDDDRNGIGAFLVEHGASSKALAKAGPVGT
jgi:sugar lactone lactonase YvrE